MNKKRPVNLDLTSLQYPPMAIASILHRISGIVLFLLTPVLLCMLHKSLLSESSFAETREMMNSPYVKLMLLAFGSAMIYHLLAGIRHLIMDLGFGEHIQSGRRSAILVIALAIILTIFLGIWLW